MNSKSFISLCCLILVALAPTSTFAAPKVKNTQNENKPVSAELQIGEDGAKSLQFNQQGADAVKNKDFGAAESYFRQALKTDPTNISAAYNLAGMYLTNKKNSEAVALLEEYTKKTATDAGLFNRLGDAYLASKDIDKAVPAYEKAYSLNSKVPGLGNKLATMYTVANRLDDAQRTLMAVINDNQKDVQALANLSSLFLARGNPDQAISTARRGLQVESRKELYLTLGAAYEAKSDKPAALIAYQRAKDLGDSSKELEEKISELK